MAYAVFSPAITTKITIVSVPHFTLISPYFNSNFVFFEKIILGSDGSGQNWILRMNTYALGISKIDILFVLEILRVITIPITLCTMYLSISLTF